MPLSGHSSITLHTNIVTLLKSGDYKGALKLVDEALPLEQENDTLCQLKDTLLQKLHLQEGDDTDSEESTTDDEQQEAVLEPAPATTAAAAAPAGGGADRSQQPAAAGSDDDADDASSSSGSTASDEEGSTSSDAEQEQHRGRAAHEQARPSPSSATAPAGLPAAAGGAGRLALDPSSFLLTRQQRSKLRAQFGAARRQQLAAQLVMDDPLLGC